MNAIKYLFFSSIVFLNTTSLIQAMGSRIITWDDWTGIDTNGTTGVAKKRRVVRDASCQFYDCIIRVCRHDGSRYAWHTVKCPAAVRDAAVNQYGDCFAVLLIDGSIFVWRWDDIQHCYQNYQLLERSPENTQIIRVFIASGGNGIKAMSSKNKSFDLSWVWNQEKQAYVISDNWFEYY